MEDNKNKSEKDLILSGICPKNHATEATVCKGCYEDLLKKYNQLKGSNGKVKSQWHTW